MSKRSASSILSVMVLLASTVGAVVVFTGAAGAAPIGCNVFVAGENIGDTALQTAINGAHAGEKICVGAGTYPEQITIATPNLHLIGVAGGGTVIDPSSGVVNAVDYDSGSNMPLIAVVVVANVSGVVLKDLTVNAAGAAASIAGCSPGIVGIDFQNVSNAKLESSAVENAILSPSLLGCQSQTGVYAYTGYYETGYTPAVATVTVTGTTVSDYGKGGIVCDDPGLTCVLMSDHVVGIGVTPAIAANGIQIAYGAVGTIVGDHVSANAFDGATATNDFYGAGWSSAGILLFQAGAGTRVSSSSVANNQIGIVGYQDVSDLISSNTVTNSLAYGIAEYGTPTTVAHIQHNSVSNPSTKSIGIFVANGTFYLTGNGVSWAQPTGTQGASQAVTGPGTVYPTAAAQYISTAAIQAVSDGGPTLVYSIGNVYNHDTARIASLAVFGGTVTVRV
ncbi:MAG: hypothetical protein WAK40_08630 [Thermoplasmata archaeon]